MIQFQVTKEVFKIFNKDEKYIFFFLIAAQFISAGLELLSIGSLLPIFKAITDPTWNETYFSFFDEKNRLIYIFLLVIFIFLIKNIFIVFLAYLTGKFRNKVSLRIINTIYRSYLNKEYKFHIDNHSSILLRNMNYADKLDANLLRLVNFYSDLILAISSISVVILIDFKITLIGLIFFCLALYCYALFSRVRIKKYADNAVFYETSYLKNMMEGLKSYREILLSGNQSYFTKRNSSYKEQSLRYNLKFQIFDIIPKYMIELFFITATISVSLYLITFSKLDIYDYLPLLGVLVVGLLKILPNFLRIFASYQQFKFVGPQIEIVLDSLNKADSDDALNIKNNSNANIKFDNDLKLKNILFKYDDKIILDNLDLKIRKNECVVIQGESGSGKSTILNILTGLLQPSSGLILVDGLEENLSSRNWQNKIGYVSQNTRLIDDTIESNIRFGSKENNSDKKIFDDLLLKTGLKSFVDNLPKGLNTIVGENGVKISGGQAQRLGLARAFFNNPEIMILDEPTNSLDKENEDKIIKTLEKLKGQLTLIIVSHDIKPLEIADTKYILDKRHLKKI